MAELNLRGIYMAKGLRDYLNFMEKEHQQEILHVDGQVNPAGFDVTALLTHLEETRPVSVGVVLQMSQPQRRSFALSSGY